MATLILSESAAAASFGFINSIGHIGGFVGPTVVGYLNDRTGTLAAAFVFIGACYVLAGCIVPLLKIGSLAVASFPAVSDSDGASSLGSTASRR